MQKKFLAILIALLSLFCCYGTAAALISDPGNPHNLSSLSGGMNGFSSTNETEICIFCHTPHGAVVSDATGNRVPLWNRSLNEATAAYTMYSSPSLQATIPSSPTGVSLLCMSCHDGISAMNVVVNYGSVYPITMAGGYDQIGDTWKPGGLQGYPGANIGELYPNGPSGPRDLSNDHPISFTYDSTLSAKPGIKLKDPGVNGANIAPLVLYTYPGGGKTNVLECATCHDPHEQGNSADKTYPFLRVSNAGSAMCLMCHVK